MEGAAREGGYGSVEGNFGELVLCCGENLRLHLLPQKGTLSRAVFLLVLFMSVVARCRLDQLENN